jgi:predicted DNA-binding protein (MmcQ/YjbR family)
MVVFETFKKLALAFPETTEEPHFEKTSFRIKKKIFATFNAKENRACIKLSAIDQEVFSTTNQQIIFPVNNNWGKQGWTLVLMKDVKEEVFIDALTTAYCEVAPQKLAKRVRPQ